MSVDFRKLRSFVKIVDTGSVSRAASILRTAAPALSQQIASLEAQLQAQAPHPQQCRHTPTEAGLISTGMPALMLKQIEQARSTSNQAAENRRRPRLDRAGDLFDVSALSFRC